MATVYGSSWVTTSTDANRPMRVSRSDLARKAHWRFCVRQPEFLATSALLRIDGNKNS
jgi:hypothetical protein